VVCWVAWKTKKESAAKTWSRAASSASGGSAPFSASRSGAGARAFTVVSPPDRSTCPRLPVLSAAAAAPAGGVSAITGYSRRRRAISGDVGLFPAGGADHVLGTEQGRAGAREQLHRAHLKHPESAPRAARERRRARPRAPKDPLNPKPNPNPNRSSC